MAYYVLVRKEAENDDHAFYQFGPNERQLGRLRFDKRSGLAEELEPVPGQPSYQFFIRALVKIREHWVKGELPNLTSWAS